MGEKNIIIVLVDDDNEIPVIFLQRKHAQIHLYFNVADGCNKELGPESITTILTT